MTPPEREGDLLWAAFPWVTRVTSASMSPTVPEGAAVRIEAISGRPVPGDVVLIQSPSGYTLHRLIGLSRDGLAVHQGDRRGARAGLVPEMAIRGRAVAVRLHPNEPWNAVPSFPSAVRWKWMVARAQAYLIARWLGLRLLSTAPWRATLSKPLRRWLL